MPSASSSSACAAAAAVGDAAVSYDHKAVVVNGQRRTTPRPSPLHILRRRTAPASRQWNTSMQPWWRSWAPSCFTRLEPTRARVKIAPQRRHGCRPTSAPSQLLADKHSGARVLGWRRIYRGPVTPEAEERPRGERARDGGESRTADESPIEAIPLPPSLPLVGLAECPCVTTGYDAYK
ncbi:uncharacterized protein [Triticum aestivum]|uniref:uncharacterized protein n=1 Tax=Triticum aestivum TaxID=4565 RepID=UPI001D02B9A4|nr:uncharacterized protein LOC123084587 [Triticum aestivum]